MALYKSIFVTVIFFIKFFLTLTTANRERTYLSCKSDMQNYCYPDKPDKDSITPSAIDCVRSAIKYWCLDEIPEGDFKDYYISFQENLVYGYRTPSAYCDFVDDPKAYAQCLDHMKEFGDTCKTALYRALYVRKFSDFAATSKDYLMNESHFGKGYMLAIQLNVFIKRDRPLKEPFDYCNDKHPLMDFES